ncbi:MAG TPA: hypothetical protein VGM37_09090 [Armatimonadota bacterium]|jgi:hypothetical protein
MKFGIAIALGALALGTTVFAQVPAPTHFTPGDVSSITSGPGNVTMTTTIDVEPYVYVSGDVSSKITVSGWGAGTAAFGTVGNNSLGVFSRGTVTFAFSALTTAKFTGSSSVPGIKTIPVSYKFSLADDEGGDYGTPVTVVGTDTGASGGPLTMITPASGSFLLPINRSISVVPDQAVGSYAATGTITISVN